MGWTGIRYFGTMTSKRRKELCDENWTQSEHDGYPELKVLKSTMVGSTYYAAVRYTKGDKSEVFGAVTLTSTKNHEFYYKEMDETVGPTERKCPTSILKLLSPTDKTWALEWRRDCEEYNRKKKEKKTPGTLPVGSVIKFTLWNGEEKVIEKKPPMYQFKRAWWYVPATHTCYSAKYIPENFEIIK